MLASEVMPEINTSKIQGIATKLNAIGEIPSIAPKVVAQPFPPLNLSHTG